LTGFRIDIKSTAGEEYLAEPEAPLAAETAMTPEEEVKEFVESESVGEPDLVEETKAEAEEVGTMTGEKEVIADNTNQE